MFIHSLCVENLLSFRDWGCLDLQPLNILIGPNGSGKSNLIECFQLLQAVPRNLNMVILRGGGPDAWLWKGPWRADDKARLLCEFEEAGEPRLEYRISFGAVNHSLAIQTERLRWADSPADEDMILDRSGGELQIGGVSAGQSNGGVKVL